MSTTRRWMYGGLVVIGLVAIGVLALAIIFRDTATPVTRDEVSDTAGSVIGTDPGDPGVYTYLTTGREQVDALSGSTHAYPAETYATLREEGCGIVLRWQPLEERFTEWTYCDGSVVPTTEYGLRQWFGIPEYTTWTCTHDSEIPAIEAGATWTDTCSNGDSIEQGTYEVVGFETLTIGATDVETVHLQRTATSDGRTTGQSTRNEWVMLDTGLLVRQVVSTESTSSTAVGTVTYVEDFSIELAELTPGA